LVNLLTLTFVFVSLAAPPGLGGGFANLDLGAERCGMMAIVAHCSDPTAIFHNPACLTSQDGSEVYFASTNYFFEGRFKIRDKEMNESPWIEPDKYFGASPFIGVVSDLGQERWRFGAALYFPNFYAAYMPEKSFARYNIVQGYFATAYVTPTAAYQISPTLSAGVGISYIYVELYAKRRMHGAVLLADLLLEDWPDADEDWELEIETRDQIFAWDLGLQWKPLPALQVGLCYTSEADINMEGDAQLSDVDEQVNPVFDLVQVMIGLLGRDNFDVSVNMLVPQSLRLGFLYRVGPRLDLGLDLVWWDYSKYKEQRITTDPDISAFINLTSVKNYTDSYHVDLGGRWHHSAATSLMAGFQYDWSPIPDVAYSVENPNSDLFGYSLGIQHEFNPTWTATLSWVNNFYERKDIKHVDAVPNVRPIGEGIVYELSFDVAYTF